MLDPMSSQTPRYGHAPIPMRRTLSEDGIEQLGDFAWDIEPNGDRYLLFTVPRPRPASPKSWIFNRLPVKQGGNVPGKHWGWDGNEDSPTLTPSIHAIGHWHGFIRSGMLVEA